MKFDSILTKVTIKQSSDRSFLLYCGVNPSEKKIYIYDGDYASVVVDLTEAENDVVTNCESFTVRSVTCI